MRTINHEYYVSFEVAELLKEAGFDWEVNHYYFTQNGKTEEKSDFRHPAQNYNEGMATMDSKSFEFEVCSRPTLDVAQRWLREVKNISIETKTRRWVNRYQDGKYTVSYSYELWPIDTSIVPSDEDKFIRYTIDCACSIEFQTYEEAFGAGIQKCLTIILNEKK